MTLVQLHLKPGEKAAPALDQQHQLILHIGEGSGEGVQDFQLVADHLLRTHGPLPSLDHAPVYPQRVPGQDDALVCFNSFHALNREEGRNLRQEVSR